MQGPLEDAVALWVLYSSPGLLQDDDLFDALMLFIHPLLLSAVRQEWEAAVRRRVQPS